MNKALGQTALSLILVLGAGAVSASAQSSQRMERTVVQQRSVQTPRTTINRNSSAYRARAQVPTSVVVTPRPRRVAAPPVQQRFVVRPIQQTYVPGGALQLSPTQRAMVYQDIMARPVEQPPVIMRQVVTAPTPVSPWWPNYSAPYVQPLVTTAEPATVYQTTPTTTGYGSGVAELAVGVSVPSDVPLYNVPPRAVSAAPALGNYLYAVVYDRIYLVDPSDGIVVAELYR